MIGSDLDGRYQIRDRIGAGGMGVVYRGLQVSIGRDVAIKVVHPSMLGDRNAARRFLREVSLAARLTSPHTVQVIDFGETAEGVLYLVMELLAGEGLDDELRRQHRLAPRRVLELALPITDALAAAHASGFVHRDLKPSNIFLSRDPGGHERVKLLDFGIARGFGASTLTGSGEVVGSPPYVAPEAIRGDELDGRVDLYALGCVLHQLLGGNPPFLGTSVADTFKLHLHDPPPPLPASVPAALREIVLRLLAKAPEDRFADAAALRVALAAALRELDHAPVVDEPRSNQVPPPPPPPPDPTASAIDTRDLRAPATPPRRVRPLVVGVVAFALALAAFGMVMLVARVLFPRPATPGAAATLDASAETPAPPPDAATLDASAETPPPPPDAAPAAVPADAAASPVDAGRRSRPPRDARPAAPVDVPPPPRIDAGMGFVLPS